MGVRPGICIGERNIGHILLYICLLSSGYLCDNGHAFRAKRLEAENGGLRWLCINIM